MTLNITKVRQYLKAFDFETLFIESLGWDRHSADLELTINGEHYPLRGFAEKRGVQVFECRAETASKMPDFKTQRKIETQLRRAAREHLVIYTDATKTKQVWKPVDWRGHEFYPGHQLGDSLIGKLQAIQIPLDEEEALDLLGAVHKLRDAFDRDRITKRFYDYFQKEHKAFLGFIEGILDQGEREWYASLMLNRLMFVYFIQKKGFLDGDKDYLRNRLQAVQSRKGKGKFHTFYRYFLLALFHQGFSTQPEQRELDPDLKSLLGDVPYLNGGLFDVHELEQHNTKIDIPDEAFERIFAFFDQYEWTLDTRPLRKDSEINPDVLGYIFEKYINDQNKMGAYYTKEDITDYMSRNTIIPYLFDEAHKKCAVAFQPGSARWRLLQDTPDRYIYPAVRKGVIDDKGEIIPIPAEIEKGIKDVADRGGWNRPAEPEYALPTETWREYVARRQRCLDVHQRLAEGNISQINHLITQNLDIRRFAEDAILSSEGPELVRAFYQAITGITVLDPTCGSGAFLFAALNILEPLYEACLDRMRTFLEDLERLGNRASPEKFKDFRAVLEEVARHPNAAYFILKSIIVRNLYGVDIMDEAVEICKLRLFLKLVSQVDNVRQLEPLPDIDFNIRPGNTLVGFATLDDVQRTILGKLADDELKAQVSRIVEEAEIVDRAFEKFHEMQTKHGMDACEFTAQKQELRNRLDRLSEQLDRYLAGEYSVDPNRENDWTSGGRKVMGFRNWQTGHRPFHWFAEFFGIMRRGGFAVVVGNPPYVVYAPSKVGYCLEPMNYKSIETKNLYAYVFERSLQLACQQSPISLIVQLTVLSSGKMGLLQDILAARGSLCAVPFPRRPESIFDGVEMPVAIVLSLADKQRRYVTSRVGRMYTQERPTVLATTPLIRHTIRIDGCRIAKFGKEIEVRIYDAIIKQKKIIDELTSRKSRHVVYYQEACRYWLKACPGMPHFKRNGKTMAPPHGRFLYFESAEAAAFVGCLLNSSLFYWYYSAFADCEHVNDGLVRSLPIPQQWNAGCWTRLAGELTRSLEQHASRKVIRTKQGHTIEYDEMKAMLSKDVLDKIDVALAAQYGLADGELDFIVHYDAKYRAGGNEEEEE